MHFWAQKKGRERKTHTEREREREREESQAGAAASLLLQSSRWQQLWMSQWNCTINRSQLARPKAISQSNCTINRSHLARSKALSQSNCSIDCSYLIRRKAISQSNCIIIEQSAWSRSFYQIKLSDWLLARSVTMVTVCLTVSSSQPSQGRAEKVPFVRSG